MKKQHNETSIQRRRVFSGLVGSMVGSQLPGSWQKPLVEAVILPAHAQMTEQSVRSTTQDGAPCPDSTLELPRVNVPVGCDVDAPDMRRYISYEIDDSDTCALAYAVGGEQQAGPGIISIESAYYNQGGLQGGGPRAYIQAQGLDCSVGMAVDWMERPDGSCYMIETLSNGTYECTLKGVSGKELIATVTIDTDRKSENLFLDIVIRPK